MRIAKDVSAKIVEAGMTRIIKVARLPKKASGALKEDGQGELAV